MMDATKYAPGYYPVPAGYDSWVKKDHIEKAPAWCSVDLRDGNQALIVPMSLEEKLEFFQMLVKIGFKEIEVGFPAASDTEYEFLRTLIEKNMIPEDVTVQVLTQCRDHIIRKTFEAVKGAPRAVIHFYNSTSVAQREQVFHKSKEEIKQYKLRECDENEVNPFAPRGAKICFDFLNKKMCSRTNAKRICRFRHLLHNHPDAIADRNRNGKKKQDS